MTVRFKNNAEPCIQYKVINPTSIWEYDEYFKKYMECIEIEVMGLVPMELLVETNCQDNLNATDLAIYLINNAEPQDKR